MKIPAIQGVETMHYFCCTGCRSQSPRQEPDASNDCEVATWPPGGACDLGGRDLDQRAIIARLDEQDDRDCLDDLVHELASDIGCNTNNGGCESQVRFIIEQMGLAAGKEAIENILKAGHAVCDGCDGSGIRVPALPSCTFTKHPIPEGAVGWELAERCDTCQKYDSDFSAALDHFGEAREILCDNGARHAVVNMATRKEQTT